MLRTHPAEQNKRTTRVDTPVKVRRGTWAVIAGALEPRWRDSVRVLSGASRVVDNEAILMQCTSRIRILFIRAYELHLLNDAAPHGAGSAHPLAFPFDPGFLPRVAV